jgi:tetratricopeptide (TPR) repeat protein
MQRAQLCQAWDDELCADDAYRTMLSLRRGSGLIHMHVGDFYRPSEPVREHQSWQKANQQYELAQNYRPHDPWLHERLGLVAANMGDLDEAINAYEAALDLTYADSAPARLYCSLAIVYEQAGQNTPADHALQACELRNSIAQFAKD